MRRVLEYNTTITEICDDLDYDETKTYYLNNIKFIIVKKRKTK